MYRAQLTTAGCEGHRIRKQVSDNSVKADRLFACTNTGGHEGQKSKISNLNGLTTSIQHLINHTVMLCGPYVCSKTLITGKARDYIKGIIRSVNTFRIQMTYRFAYVAYTGLHL